MYKYKFSIVMAVYNVELFLAEAIESILSQDIGFQENIQLILVDDGSKDNSGRICDTYASKYPSNIVVIHKENGGVSTARNEGLKHITGKYVNFLDSDDTLSKSTLRVVYDFFEEHYCEIDLVSIPIVFFEGKSGNHILNYKFKAGTRVINLQKEYNAIQLSLSSAFIKNEVAKTVCFDKRLKFAEDAKECIKILLNKQKLGVVKEGTYNYRKRLQGQESALQNATLKKAWYMPYLNYFSYSSLNKALEVCGYIPKFVQFTIMYDLQWRFKVDIETVKSVIGEEASNFINTCYDISSKCDDEVILKQRNINIEDKTAILCCKHNTIPQIKMQDGKYCICVQDTVVCNFDSKELYFDFLTYDKENIYIEGCLLYEVGLESPKLCAVLSGKDLDLTVAVLENKTKFVFDKPIMKTFAFKCTVPKKLIENGSTIVFYSLVNTVKVQHTRFIARKNFPLVESFDGSHIRVDNYIFTMNRDSIVIEDYSKIKNIKLEIKYLKWLFTSSRIGARKAFFVRSIYHVLKPFMPDDIWLISDRINKADDNGEAFWKFLHENGLHNHSYFVIQKESSDYDVIKQYGKVLDYYSLKHRIIHLMSRAIISSAGDDYVFCPFFSRNYYKDLLWKQKKIFLQHGITKDDISGWLNRYSKNLDIFITAAKPEYMSIMGGTYYYDESVVKLTGFSRFDRLIDKREKIITIMPTWRASLTRSSNYAVTGKDKYDEDFFESSYFKFYNMLINSKRLLTNAQKLGYRIKFMPHPRVITFIDGFTKNECVEFCDINTKYRDIFGQSSLVLTDYSSVAFDFAYLRKPVIYAQFDRDELFKGQVYDEGYFSYERDGFGEVEYDLDSTIDRIIEYMENDCCLKEKYKKRIDGFFAFNDKNNCERIYKEIKALLK